MMQESPNLLVFCGQRASRLAGAICEELSVPLGKALVGRFSDGEVQIEIEENVRQQDVFVIQPTCAPTADNFMELLALIDALKRASASSVTAVIPYFGYRAGSPPALRACDHDQGRGGNDRRRRHRPRADRGHPRRPDPGLFRHSRSTTCTPRRCCSPTSGAPTAPRS
jgi:hypothetical protein